MKLTSEPTLPDIQRRFFRLVRAYSVPRMPDTILMPTTYDGCLIAIRNLAAVCGCTNESTVIRLTHNYCTVAGIPIPQPQTSEPSPMEPNTQSPPTQPTSTILTITLYRPSPRSLWSYRLDPSPPLDPFALAEAIGALTGAIRNYLVCLPLTDSFPTHPIATFDRACRSPHSYMAPLEPNPQ